MLTTMGAAFERAGLRPEDVKLDKAIALALNVYLNSGGTKERASQRLLEAAEELDGEAKLKSPQGQRTSASTIQPELAGGATGALPKGQQEHALSSQANCEANVQLPNGQLSSASQSQGDVRGQSKVASSGRVSDASPSPPIANGAGQTPTASQARVCVPRPVREPSALQTEADLAARLKTLSVFDRELTYTGRKWGNIPYRDLDSMREDGDIAAALKVHIGSLRGDSRHKLIRDLMTPREFAQLINRVRRSYAA